MKLRRISRKYYGVKCGGYSASGKPKAVCLHSTEGSTAAGAASYLHTRPDGSVHIVVDDKEAFRLLNDSKVACGAGGYNDRVIHIEQAGFASWSRKQWLRRIRTLRRAAYWTAVSLRKHDLKPRPLKGKAAIQRGNGYTFHAWVMQAGYPTTHYDPGPHYPYLKERALIRFYYHIVRAKG